MRQETIDIISEALSELFWGNFMKVYDECYGPYLKDDKGKFILDKYGVVQSIGEENGR